MMLTLKETQVEIRRLGPEDIGGLYDYLQNLSSESKKRFGPHSFERQAIADFYQKLEEHLGYVAMLQFESLCNPEMT